jgi:hypothetical protein
VKYYLTIIFSFSIALTNAQDTSFRLIRSFKGEIADAAIDNLDNVYVLTNTNQLKKYNNNGDSMAVYNNVRQYGKVAAIDVSNPLKVLLFYKDFSSIIILDRLLGVRSTLDLRRNNLLQVTAIGLSYDNNIWAFDAYDNKLKKIDEQGKVLSETPDLRTVFNQGLSPLQIIDHNKQVYLYDPAMGVFVFDNYGTFKRKIPITGWASVDVSDKYIMGINSQSLQSYNISTLLQAQQKFPGNFTPYYSYHVSNNRLLALAKEGLFIYGF